MLLSLTFLVGLRLLLPSLENAKGSLSSMLSYSVNCAPHSLSAVGRFNSNFLSRFWTHQVEKINKYPQQEADGTYKLA